MVFFDDFYFVLTLHSKFVIFQCNIAFLLIKACSQLSFVNIHVCIVRMIVESAYFVECRVVS
jgi:hypothetical protein